MLATEVVNDLRELEQLSTTWTALLERCSTNEPTLSPLWILSWWRVFGPLDGRELRVVAFNEADHLVGLAPLLSRRYRWGPRLTVRRLELLASGEREADEICSDYIGILAERGREREVALKLAELLGARALGPWDELVLPSMSGESAMVSLLADALERLGAVQLTDMGEAPFIPLPRSWDEYLAALSPSHRYQIRRRLRDFERWAGGAVAFEVATKPADLERGFKILQELHGARWRAEGKRGAFASPHFCAFHRTVLPRLLDLDALDLCWLSVRGEPVAALYNIVWDGKVHYYQSGRVPDLPKGLMPGVVIHTHAIRRAIERGCREYDFLVGASQTKKLFARKLRPIHGLSLVRPSLVTKLRAAVDVGKDLGRVARDWWRQTRSPKTRPDK